MTHQINDLKVALIRKRSELKEAIRAHSIQLKIDEGEHDLIDQIQGMNRRNEAATFLDTLNHTLAAVIHALQAIEDGSYGECAECGEPIASKRLVAIPWASHCIQCQQMLDHRMHTAAPAPYWGEAA